MKVYPLEERHLPEWISFLQRDFLCIYPTDSIYGIGGIANQKNADAVNRIKKRGAHKSFSVIAPSVQWVKKRCIVPESFDSTYQEPTTYLFEKKDRNDFLHLSNNEQIGIRFLPHSHPIQKLVTKLQQPLITTSANYSGEPVGTTIEKIPTSLLHSVDFVIDAGIPLTTPSRLYDVTTGKEIRRT